MDYGESFGGFELDGDAALRTPVDEGHAGSSRHRRRHHQRGDGEVTVNQWSRLRGKDAPSRAVVDVCGAGGDWPMPSRPGPVPSCSGGILEMSSSDGGAGCELKMLGIGCFRPEAVIYVY